jgi:hypothetical protein
MTDLVILQKRKLTFLFWGVDVFLPEETKVSTYSDLSALESKHPNDFTLYGGYIIDSDLAPTTMRHPQGCHVAIYYLVSDDVSTWRRTWDQVPCLGSPSKLSVTRISWL